MVVFYKDFEVADTIVTGSWLEYVSEGRIQRARYTLTELYETFTGRKDVIIIPHVGGRFANLSFHEPSLEPPKPP